MMRSLNNGRDYNVTPACPLEEISAMPVPLQDYGLSRSIKIWMLYLDDDPVSFCLVLDTGPIRYQLVNGYSKSVKQYSTGHILFKEMIFDAIETGVQRICFGQGDPGHKREWGAKSSVELIDLIAMKPGLFGKLVSVVHSSSLLKFLKIIFKFHF